MNKGLTISRSELQAIIVELTKLCNEALNSLYEKKVDGEGTYEERVMTICGKVITNIRETLEDGDE